MPQAQRDGWLKSEMEQFASELAPSTEDLAASLAPAAESGKPSAGSRTSAGNIDMIMRIPVSVKIVLGATTMPVSRLMKLGRGAVIPLDRRVGEPVDVVVNGHVVARGEVVIVDEETSRFGVSLTEVLGSSPREQPI